MIEVHDINLGEDFDLEIKNGDFDIGETTLQHQQLLIIINKGMLREFPSRCVGLPTWINDDKSGNLNAAIKREFEADGMKVQAINAIGDKITTDAYYE